MGCEQTQCESHDHILEIGCGQGAAAALICEKLMDGKVAGIDRSVTMIQAAEKRNISHIASGRAEFYAMALRDTDVGMAKFNKVFAVNVNIFWQKPARELAMIDDLLTHDGYLYLFYQPPIAEKVSAIATALQSALQKSPFSIVDQQVEALQSGLAIYLVANR